MRQLAYTMFISNNRSSFHSWWNESLVKDQKIVWKYYEKNCLQNFYFLFMSLLAAKFIKKSHMYTRVYFIFLKNILKQTWKSFNTKSWPRWKDGKSSKWVRQLLASFSNLIALILSENCAKGLSHTKIISSIKFEGVWTS